MEHSSKDYQPSESCCWDNPERFSPDSVLPTPNLCWAQKFLLFASLSLLCPNCPFLAQSYNILGLNLFCWDSSIQVGCNGPETFSTPTFSPGNSKGIGVLACERPHCWGGHPSSTLIQGQTPAKHLLQMRYRVRCGGRELRKTHMVGVGWARSSQAYSVADMEPGAEH